MRNNDTTAAVMTQHYRFDAVNQHGQVRLEIERNIHSSIHREKIRIYLTLPEAQHVVDLLTHAIQSPDAVPVLPNRLQEIAAKVKARFGYPSAGVEVRR